MSVKFMIWGTPVSQLGSPALADHGKPVMLSQQNQNLMFSGLCVCGFCVFLIGLCYHDPSVLGYLFSSFQKLCCYYYERVCNNNVLSNLIHQHTKDKVKIHVQQQTFFPLLNRLLNFLL